MKNSKQNPAPSVYEKIYQAVKEIPEGYVANYGERWPAMWAGARPGWWGMPWRPLSRIPGFPGTGWSTPGGKSAFEAMGAGMKTSGGFCWRKATGLTRPGGWTWKKWAGTGRDPFVFGITESGSPKIGCVIFSWGCFRRRQKQPRDFKGVRGHFPGRPEGKR